MKILMVHPHDLFSNSEPWTIRIKKIASQFKEKGHSVKLVYFPLNSRDANRQFFSQGIEIIALDRRLGAGRLFSNIARMIKLGRWSDVIHFQKCYYYVVLPALIASWVNNKPVHYDWDDSETRIFYYSNPDQFVIGEFLNIFEKLIPNAVDTISVSSDSLRKMCLARGVDNQAIVSAHVGADLDHFNPNLNSSGKIKEKYGVKGELVLYVGQLHGGQYAELFIKAASRIIKENNRDVHFMIVGDGYRLKELKILASVLAAADRFIFTGFVAHEEVPFYINDADICVACFEDNAITRCKSPLKITEYLASGKAIVASNVGEVRRMVGGVGVLTCPGQEDSLAEGIKLLLNDKLLRDRLGAYARKRAEEKYNWAVTAENILRAYQTTLTDNYGRNNFAQEKEEVDMVDSGKSGKTDQEFDILTARVVSVTSHKDAPYTVEAKIKKFFGQFPAAFTVDPRCSFYKDDREPKTINVIKPGDIVEVTYLVHEGIKVAFNFVVKPKKAL